MVHCCKNGCMYDFGEELEEDVVYKCPKCKTEQYFFDDSYDDGQWYDVLRYMRQLENKTQGE